MSTLASQGVGKSCLHDSAIHSGCNSIISRTTMYTPQLKTTLLLKVLSSVPVGDMALRDFRRQGCHTPSICKKS